MFITFLPIQAFLFSSVVDGFPLHTIKCGFVCGFTALVHDCLLFFDLCTNDSEPASGEILMCKSLRTKAYMLG